MMTTIYLVRHGDVHNPDQVLYERIPGFGLSELGQKQAHALGTYLATKSIAALYASPLQRTQETAGIIASYHSKLRIISDERLIEVSTPARGRKMEELARENWNFYKKEHIQNGGERLSDIWKRMQLFFADMTRKHPGETIIAVSHGDPIMISEAKHSGKKLGMHAIRGANYIETAHGLELRFQQGICIGVSRLDF